MIQPDGGASLAVRRSYLRRRRARRSRLAAWSSAILLVLWLALVGFVGLTH